MAKKILRFALYGLIAFLVIAQFFRIDKTNPESDPAQDLITLTQAPEDISTLLVQACYDCHSHDTEYPWYSNVAPVSWWIKDHVNHARKHLNFARWGEYELKRAHHKLEECVEEVEEGEMPLKSFTWTHAEARISPEQRAALVSWFQEQYDLADAKMKAPPEPETVEEERDEDSEEE